MGRAFIIAKSFTQGKDSGKKAAIVQNLKKIPKRRMSLQKPGKDLLRVRMHFSNQSSKDLKAASG